MKPSLELGTVSNDQRKSVGGGASTAPATSPTVGEITTFWLGFALGAFAPAAFIVGAWSKEALLWMIP